jgi:hypothetical protein
MGKRKRMRVRRRLTKKGGIRGTARKVVTKAFRRKRTRPLMKIDAVLIKSRDGHTVIA